MYTPKSSSSLTYEYLQSQGGIQCSMPSFFSIRGILLDHLKSNGKLKTTYMKSGSCFDPTPVIP